MGWLFFEKPNNVKKYFENQFSWENDTHTMKVLDSAIVNVTEYYAAVEKLEKSSGDREVFAVMCMLKFITKGDDPYNFGYKDMDETCGPVDRNCPERILKLLTPTDHEYATQWRADCWKNVERGKALRKLKVGDTVEHPKGLHYGGYGKVHRFRIESKKPYLFTALDGSLRGYKVKMRRDNIRQLQKVEV